MSFPERAYILDSTDEVAGVFRILDPDAPLPWTDGINFLVKPDAGSTVDDLDVTRNCIYWGPWGEGGLRFLEYSVILPIPPTAYGHFFKWARSAKGLDLLHRELGDVVVARDAVGAPEVNAAETGVVSVTLFVDFDRPESDGAVGLRQLAPERPTFREVVDRYRWLQQLLAAHSGNPAPRGRRRM